MYIGIDLGTFGVKAILLSEDQRILASHSEPLRVSRPHPLWSEQNPEHWWQATDTALRALAANHSLRGVKAVGLVARCTAQPCWTSGNWWRCAPRARRPCARAPTAAAAPHRAPLWGN